MANVYGDKFSSVNVNAFKTIYPLIEDDIDGLLAVTAERISNLIETEEFSANFNKAEYICNSIEVPIISDIQTIFNLKGSSPSSWILIGKFSMPVSYFVQLISAEIITSLLCGFKNLK